MCLVAYWLTAGLGRALGQVRWRFLLIPGESWSQCGSVGTIGQWSRQSAGHRLASNTVVPGPAGLTEPDTSGDRMLRTLV